MASDFLKQNPISRIIILNESLSLFDYIHYDSYCNEAFVVTGASYYYEYTRSGVYSLPSSPIPPSSTPLSPVPAYAPIQHAAISIT